MASTHFLAISCGASHLCSVHLKMNPSGRCEVVDFQIDAVEFSSHDPMLWLKATSGHLDAVALRFRSEMPAGFAIPGHVALSKYLKIPQVAGSKRQKIIAFEARQNIPYTFSEVTWGHTVVEEDDLDFDALIGAARTEVVETIARYSKDAEIELRCIEPSTTALLNGFRYNYADVSGCSLLISIGAKSTDMIFVDKNRFHSRNVPFGGQSISISMAEALGVSVSEAERIKISACNGEALPTEEFAAFDSARQGFFNRLATEVARTSTVMKRQGFDFEADSCFVSGGGSLLLGLEEELANKLALKVERYDPTKNMKVEGPELLERLEAAKPFLGEAIGLGLGRFLPDAASVDLTPRSLVWQRMFRRQQPFYIVAGLVACAAIGLPILNTTLEIRTYEQELQNLDVQIAPLSQLNQDIHERSEQVKRVKEIIEEAGDLAEARDVWMRLLNDLQTRLAQIEDVWLDKLRLERPDPVMPSGRGHARVRKADTSTKLRLEGRLIDVYNPVSSVSPDSYERVKALLESLRQSSFVESLTDERFDYSVPGILGFDFTLVIRDDAPL